MLRLKPRLTHMMVLTCGAVILLFGLFAHLEKESGRLSIHSRTELSHYLVQNDRNVAQIHGISSLGDHVGNIEQTRTVSHITREVLLKSESNKNEESNSNPITNSIAEIQHDLRNTSIVQNVTNKDATNLVHDKDELVSEILDVNNEFDLTTLDELITLDRLVHSQNMAHTKVDKPVDSHEDTLTKRRMFKWNGDYEQALNNSEQYRSNIYRTFHRHVTNQHNVNCSAVIRHDGRELAKAHAFMSQVPRRAIPVERYARSSDCENFRGGRGYIEHPLSQIELDFPLAFSMLVYRDVEQAERLLRSIYRPHNVYCIHLDIKMKPIERTAMEKVANCLENVFVADTSINVTWGEFSVLDSELICMKFLMQYKRWKYYINLTGQEFPLKTNKEIVSILKSLQGANIVDGTWIRAREKYFYRWTQAGQPPPHKIRPIKGSVHVAVNRQFVDFALNDYRASDFLEWLKKTQIPDETFFASLNHNPSLGINGSFLGEAEEYPLKPSLMRYKNWELGHSVFVRRCEGKYVRHICVLGVGDLSQAYSDIGLFVNKFMIDFEYLALDCLEEVLYKRTWTQYVKDEHVDTSYYQHLDYVKKQLVVQS